MEKEIERKYLVKGDFKSYSSRSYRISQGYLSHDNERTVRVRIRDNSAFLTIKGRQTGISRFEWESEIPLADGEELLKLCAPSIIEKTRYIVRHGKHTIEVDEFSGSNSGLILAEIELDSEREVPKVPGWVGEEVSTDIRYHNSYLSKHPYTEW